MDKLEVIKEKEQLIEELNEANKELMRASISYKTVQSEYWLNTDFEEKLGKKRPTVDEKKAYISYHTMEHREQRDIAEYNREYLMNKIRLCEDKLSVL